MLRTALASRRPALLRAQSSFLIHSYQQDTIYKRYGSTSQDSESIIRRRNGHPTRPTMTSKDLPSVPEAALYVPPSDPDSESSLLLSKIMSASKKEGQSLHDQTKDAGIRESLKKAYSKLTISNGLRTDRKRINVISSSLCGKSLLDDRYLCSNICRRYYRALGAVAQRI